VFEWRPRSTRRVGSRCLFVLIVVVERQVVEYKIPGGAIDHRAARGVVISLLIQQ
jgi:hypothetical protein